MAPADASPFAQIIRWNPGHAEGAVLVETVAFDFCVDLYCPVARAVLTEYM